MTGEDREFDELSAAAALHALSADEERAFAQARAAHPEREREVSADEEAAALLGEAVAPVTPPPALRAALLARIAADATEPGYPAEPSVDVAEPPAPTTPTAEPRRRRVWFALAASVALLAALGVGAVSLGQALRPAAVVAIEQITSAPDAGSASGEMTEGDGTATVHWSASEKRSVLVASGMAALPADETYELWFVRPDGAVPAGTFDPAEDGSATALLTGDYREGDVIAVTVEPDGGSPTGSPTSDPILVIPT